MTRLRTTAVPLGVAALAAATALVAAAQGCSLAEYDKPNPVEIGSPDLGAGASSSGGSGPAKPRARTVGTRNPWGNVPGNLLLDGDFELSAGAGNSNLPGWQAFRGSGDGSVHFETGGLCRSGLRCAVAEPGMALLGWGIAADGVAMEGSIWVKVPEGSGCDVVTVGILLWSQFTVSDLFAPEDPVPDDAGWCHLSRRVSPKNEPTLFYVEVALPSGERALLDDARLVPATGSAPMSASAREPTAAQHARARAALEWARSRVRYGRADEPRPRLPPQ
ncbi:MAG: hypothetical protein JRI23_31890 [Deltaproteobacteria bacterium]|jgi:hypothetical protein|nr:hypothetical protein [Deltaproteobacteria bacterium]MBW2536826.1 hypothetical protein [Deltaproteobacteria bacterium]